MILNDWCCLVIQDCGVIYVREKKRLVKEIDNMRSWDGTVRSTRILISRKQLREATIVGVGLICLLLFVYRYILFDKWNYSYANCLYRWLPFSSSGVETKGYCYSDISDNVLPIAYTSLHKGIFSFWLPQFSIGAPQGINLYFSVLISWSILFCSPHWMWNSGWVSCWHDVFPVFSHGDMAGMASH